MRCRSTSTKDRCGALPPHRALHHDDPAAHLRARRVPSSTSCRARSPGALVECGVWRGGSMMAVALTLLRLGVTDRDLYLFDTFEGMTEPGEEDVRRSGERAADMLAGSSRDSHDLGVRLTRRGARGRFERRIPGGADPFRTGPVEETLPGACTGANRPASARHGLVRVHQARARAPVPRVAPGGVLIIDDYAYWEGARRRSTSTSSEHVRVLLNRIDYTARIQVAVRPLGLLMRGASSRQR